MRYMPVNCEGFFIFKISCQLSCQLFKDLQEAVSKFVEKDIVSSKNYDFFISIIYKSKKKSRNFQSSKD